MTSLAIASPSVTISAAAPDTFEPQTIHALRGRVRFSLGAWSGRGRREIEAHLRALPGVKSAEANAVTGNVLLKYDPALTGADDLLSGVRRVWRNLPSELPSGLPLQSPTGKTEPAPKNQPDPMPPPAISETVPAPPIDSSTRNDARASVASPKRGRARIAVRGLDRDPAVAKRVEEHLERTPGVKARANPLTGRVLVEFNEYQTELADLIAQVADIEMPELPGEDRPAYPLDPAPLVQSATRTAAATLGLGVLAARQAAGATGSLPGAGTASQVSGAIGIVQGFPAFRNGARRLLGTHNADLLFNGANIVSLTFAGSPLGLTLAGVEAAGLLTEVLSRRAAWKTYREKTDILPEARAGEPFRMEAGERAPLSGILQEGEGHAIGRNGLPHPIGPKSRIESGERLQGGPFTLLPQAGSAFEPQARPVPPREALEHRYSRLLGPLSLGYAALTGVFTLSPARAFESLLLLNPRAALIGSEGANTAASARVLRGGVTVVGTRLGRPLRRFDWLLMDGARILCDGLELSRIILLDKKGDAAELLSLAAGIAAASGTPWGGVFPAANRAPAQNGSFKAQGGIASATVSSTRYTLGEAQPADIPSSHRIQSGEYELVLRSDRSAQPLALFVLRPKLSASTRELVETCQRHGVKLVLFADAATPHAQQKSIAAIAHRLGGETLPAASEHQPESGAESGAVAAIREMQADGDRVAFASDSPDAGAAFAACDLAIGITSGRSRFAARADVLAPDAGAIAAIIEAGARRDLASRDGVAFSLIANVVGLLWGWRGGTGLARASRAVYVAALAALGSAWWRENGGERAYSMLARVVDPRPEKWARRSLRDVLHALDTTRRGLTEGRAQERLRTLPPPVSMQQHGWRENLLLQLRSPLNGVLLLGGALSFVVGGTIEAALIGGTILFNSAIGAWQQGQANRAAQALEQMSSPQVRVLRDGEPKIVSSREVVPGDVMLLASGDRVGADARVLEAQSLEVDEAALTGESLPVTKTPDGADDNNRILLEGSDVTTGAGQAVVVAVGRNTRMGAMAAAMAVGEDGTSPLDQRLNAMLRQSLPWSIGAGVLVTVSALLRGQTLISQAALGASVAVSAVPEGLPLLAKMGEAAVAKRLSGHNAVVRRLSAVESLGRVDVACTDKTGTLTQGKLALSVVADAQSQASLPAPGSEENVVLPPHLLQVLECAGLASPHPDAPDAAAHPTDVSVTQGALRAGLGEAIRIQREAESPFDPVRGFHASQNGVRLCVKGATEALIARCDRVRRQEHDEPLDDAGREALSQRSQELASQGLRVLMVAQGDSTSFTDSEQQKDAVSDPRGLVALGFVGISDPLRENVPQAVQRCHAAGVRVIMLTGDHPATARAIAREAGLFDWHDGNQSEVSEEERILTGSELAELVNGELDAALERAVVVARATPLDKVRIVESLQRKGHTVAMTGDGVNDAPALRLADVGVAMGRGGTEVARQAADVVLSDDDFSTLVEALVEGRSFWRNIRRALGLLIGGNLGELSLQVGASLIGLTPPLTTTQVLAVNLITDVLPAVAVALQGPESRNLSSLSREGTAAFDAPLRSDVLRRGGSTAIPSILVYILSSAVGGQAQGRSVAFISIVATQLAQTLDAGRTEGGITRPVMSAVVGSLSLLGVALATPGLRDLFALVIPTPVSWALIGAGVLASVALSRTLPTLGSGVETNALPQLAAPATATVPSSLALPPPALPPGRVLLALPA